MKDPKTGLRDEWLTLPNILTSSRILLIPVFIWMMIRQRPFEAFLVFLLAGFTDVLDGLAARLWRQRSSVGLWLDPAADKLLLTTAFISLSLVRINRPNVIPFWLTSVVIGRDVLIVLAVILLYRLKKQRTFYPSLWGKISTVSQVLTVFGVLLFNSRGTCPSFLFWFYETTLAATVLSGLHYLYLAWPVLCRPKTTKTN